ncbi:MAG: hypothetical protein AB7E15_09705 [Azospira sp.]
MSQPIYHYDPATGIFTGADVARESPMEPGVFLIPANATTEPPPECGDDQRPVFREGAWVVEGIPQQEQPPQPTLEELQASCWARIKALCDGLQSGGVKVGTKWYHSDVDSRIKYIGLKDQARDLLAAGQPDSTRLQKLGQDVRWKTMDGSFIYLTVKHVFDIVNAVGDLDAAAFAAAETHRVAMEASADPAAYDFSVGWPATFAG